MKIKKEHIPLWAAVLALVLCAVALALFLPRSVPERDYEPLPFDQPFYVIYQRVSYVYRGHILDALPQSAVLIGPVNNIEHGTPEKDLDGNIDGYFFLDADDPEHGYFRYRKWDEETEGRKEPILIMEREED